MARYWVGGTATWNGTADTKWSLTSGGAGGEAVPTSSDDVFFDAASGAVTCTTSGSQSAKTLTFTGFTGTFAMGSSLFLSGSMTLGSAMTFTNAGGDIVFSASGTLTSNGVTISSSAGGFLRPSGAVTITLGGVLVLGGASPMGISSSSSTPVFATANFAVTAAGVGWAAGTFTPGSSTITLTGSGASTLVITGTLSANTATFKLTNATASTKTVSLGSNTTWSTIWLTGAGTGAFLITTSGTIGTLLVDTPPHTLTFTAGITVTIGTAFTVNGTSGNLMTLQSSSAGSAFTLSKSSGTVSVEWCSIKDSTATGGASWLATNSLNVSGNTGWVFGSASFFGFGKTIPFAALLLTAGVLLVRRMCVRMAQRLASPRHSFRMS